MGFLFGHNYWSFVSYSRLIDFIAEIEDINDIIFLRLNVSMLIKVLLHVTVLSTREHTLW